MKFFTFVTTFIITFFVTCWLILPARGADVNPYVKWYLTVVANGDRYVWKDNTFTTKKECDDFMTDRAFVDALNRLLSAKFEITDVECVAVEDPHA